jgi:hypothetical protein
MEGLLMQLTNVRNIIIINNNNNHKSLIEFFNCLRTELKNQWSVTEPAAIQTATTANTL